MTSSSLNWRNWIKAGLVLLCLVGLFSSFAPQPSFAGFRRDLGHSSGRVSDGALSSIEKAITAIFDSISSAIVALWEQIYAWVSVIVGYINQFMSYILPDQIYLQGMMRTAARATQAKIDTRTAQALVDGHTKDTYLKNVVSAFVEAPMPMAENQTMCRASVSCTAPAMMRDFVEVMTNMITASIMEATRDGDGPAYVYARLRGRCGEGPGGVKTANPMDGYSSGCAVASSSLSLGAADADISASILDSDNVFQLPKMESVSTVIDGQSVTRSLPDVEAGSSNKKDVAEKKAFLMAVQYCTNLAAGHEKNPTGKQLDTPEGRTKKVRLLSYESRKEAFVRTCARRVAMMTRPDCSDPAFADICEATAHSCNAAQANNMDMSPSLRGCSAGMNLFQAEQVCVEGCLSNKQNEARAAYGQGASDIMKALDQCGKNQADYKKLMATREEVLTQAVKGLQTLEMYGY